MMNPFVYTQGSKQNEFQKEKAIVSVETMPTPGVQDSSQFSTSATGKAHKHEDETLLGAVQRLIKEIQVLSLGLKQDLAYRRVTKYQGQQHKTITIAAANTPQAIRFDEPVNNVAVSIVFLGTATTVYVEIEGTAGTDGIQLNTNLRTFNFGDIPVQQISFMVDAGTTTVVQVYALRGG